MQMDDASHEQLSFTAMGLISRYLSYQVGSNDASQNRTISIPYYNNRRGKVRAGLRAMVGKGSPADIKEEIELLALREKFPLDSIDTETFKKFLVDNHIGIDCSGFAYHILNTESEARKKGTLREHLTFPFAKGMRRLITYLRPIENAGVTVFAHDKNSKVIALNTICAGDFITMTHEPEESAYDHIVVIHKVERDETGLKKIHYSQSIAWPSDGRYGHGVRQGLITISNPLLPISEQQWIENGKEGEENFTHQRAKKAKKTEIRRLNWF